MTDDHLDMRGVPAFARPALAEEHARRRRNDAPSGPPRQDAAPPGAPRAGVPAYALATFLVLVGCATHPAAASGAGGAHPLPAGSGAAPLLLAQLDAIADRVDALEANRSLPAELAQACPHGVESLRTFGAEVAGRCRWPKARPPRAHGGRTR